MVAAILKAAAKVLVSVGYDRASTKRIAREASISIGSLYQYFPGKEAVVAELMDRHIESVRGLLEKELLRLRGEDLQRTVRGVVAAFFRAQHVDPALRRVFIEQVPRIGKLNRLAEVESRVTDLARAYLQTRRHEIARTNLDLAAVVVVRTIAHLTYHALVDDAKSSETAWIEEITTLVCAYLGGGSSSTEE